MAGDEIGEIHRLKYSVKTRNSEGRGRGGMERVEGRKEGRVCVGWSGVRGGGWGAGSRTEESANHFSTDQALRYRKAGRCETVEVA